MARLKRGSVTLDKARRRMAGMESIQDILEFGDGLSLPEYNARIQTLQMQLSSYNTMLSKLDEMASRVTMLEQELSSYSERMLMSVATRYGKESLQYMQAGGKSRKRVTRSTSTPAIAPVVTTATTSATTNGNGAKASVI